MRIQGSEAHMADGSVFLAENPDAERLSQGDVAEYIATITGELSAMAEGARLEGLATILYAAQLEARRALQRLEAKAPHTRRIG
jgi:hypothetical protein